MHSEGGILVPKPREIERVQLDGFSVEGRVRARLFGPDGKLKTDQLVKNIITVVGRQYLTKRAANIATLPGQVSGMKLGNDSATAAALTGAGAHIVTYITGSQKAIDGSFPTETQSGNGSRITWQTTWGAGVVTNADIEEVIITNEASLTDAAGSSANTLSRAIIAQVNKGAGDTLVVTWQWDIGVT